jgi:hypothetical protein
MVESKIFLSTANGRHKGRSQDEACYYIAPDLYSQGVAAIGSGAPLKKYKERARCNWNNEFGSVSLDEVDLDEEALTEFICDEEDDDIIESQL